MATVGDLRVERLLERLAAQERRHAEELLNLEVEYVLKITAMMNNEDPDEDSDEDPEEDPEEKEDGDAELESEEVQGSDSSTADGSGGSGED